MNDAGFSEVGRAIDGPALTVPLTRVRSATMIVAEPVLIVADIVKLTAPAGAVSVKYLYPPGGRAAAMGTPSESRCRALTSATAEIMNEHARDSAAQSTAKINMQEPPEMSEPAVVACKREGSMVENAKVLYITQTIQTCNDVHAMTSAAGTLSTTPPDKVPPVVYVKEVADGRKPTFREGFTHSLPNTCAAPASTVTAKSSRPGEGPEARKA